MANIKKSDKLNLASCVTILIGGMFGSAIFSLLGLTIYNAGPATLISWFASAPIMLIYGLLMAELACYYPKSGGVYVFPAKAIKGSKGKFWGWISCWSFIICNLVAIAFSAIYIGQYLSSTFQALNNFEIPIALFAMLLVLILNLIKLKNSSHVNTILVVLLISLMLVFVVVSICNPAFSTSRLIPFFDQGEAGKLGFVSMIPISLISYGAIISVAFMASEIKNPKKNIPLASLISIFVLAIVYCLIIFATLGLVTSQFLSLNPDLQMLPLVAASMQLINTPWIIYVITIASVIALFTSMNVLVSINARGIMAASQDKILPKAFSATSKNGQPFIAVIITVIICSILCIFPSYVNDFVNLGVLFNIITIFIVVISLMFARKNEKLPKNAFKLRGGYFWPILFLLLIFACNISNIFTSNLFNIVIYTIILLVVGIFIYMLSKFRSC